jgi:hypothetical protein
MRLTANFRRVRFGLGVALLTDGYYGYDTGAEFYGSPTFYTEYEAKLGQAVADPVRVYAGAGGLGGQGVGEEVWMREFDGGFIVVSSISTSNFTVTLPVPVHELPLSTNAARLTGQREAPAWQFVVDNSPPGGTDPFPEAGGQDWWAAASNRSGFTSLLGNWTVVTDDTESHQIGASFLVGFTEPGGLQGTSQGLPGAFSGAWSFEAPTSGLFSFSTTAVDAHLYPLTDAALVCVRKLSTTGAARTNAIIDGCLARGTIDQRAGIRDGRWQRMLSSVPLQAKTSYEVVLSWDSTSSGCVTESSYSFFVCLFVDQLFPC